MGERIKPTIPVFLALTRDDEVYLQRRYNTGYMNGFYEFIAGKVDERESLLDAVAREAREEAGIVVRPENLTLFHTYLNNSYPDDPWLGLMFKTDTWEGEPGICEPEKCDDSGFFKEGQYPANVTPQVRDGLAQLALNTPKPGVAYYNLNEIADVNQPVA